MDGDRLHDLAFTALPSLLARGDVVVFNDTKVIRARVHGMKSTGGRAELLIERVTRRDGSLGAGPRKPRATRRIAHRACRTARAQRVLARDDRFHRLAFEGTGPLHAWLERHGEVPLPPYIARQAEPGDRERYQTIYAREPGAVAAPTAGLHFDEAIMAALEANGIERAFVTLHVGAGTFQPVQHEDLARHVMHEEWFTLPPATVDADRSRPRARWPRRRDRHHDLARPRIGGEPKTARCATGPSRTALFITPGYRFHVVDRLVTNFHLPRSTLLMLVSAFAGHERIRAAYAHAIAARYRFFSYGDAMLLSRA